MKEHIFKRIPLPMPADTLVPHRLPMLLVDSLVERQGDRAAVIARMPAGGICFEPDRGFPEFYIEIVAQAVALANGYDALCRGEKIKDGMLVGIDSFSFYTTVRPGAVLSIDVEKTFEFGAVKIIHGRICHEDVLLAEGDIKVWEDLGQEGM